MLTVSSPSRKKDGGWLCKRNGREEEEEENAAQAYCSHSPHLVSLTTLLRICEISDRTLTTHSRAQNTLCTDSHAIVLSCTSPSWNPNWVPTSLRSCLTNLPAYKQTRPPCHGETTYTRRGRLFGVQECWWSEDYKKPAHTLFIARNCWQRCMGLFGCRVKFTVIFF